MNVSARIADLQKQRALKATVLDDLATKSEKENRVFDADEQAGFDETVGVIKGLDEHIGRLRETESIMARGAVAVNEPRIETRGQEKGIRFARLCQAIAASKGNFQQAQEIAKMQWPQDRDISEVLRAQSFGVTRAAVAAGTTTDAAWAGALVSAANLSGEIIELVMKESIIGKLTKARRVPFNVRIQRQTVALGSAGWVGQGQSKPFGRGSFDFITIPWAKVALIVAITEELARFSNPQAETLMRDLLVRAIRDFLDEQFVNSAIAPVANLSPGGITNGLPGGQTFASAGNTHTLIQADISRALVRLHAGNAPVAPVWIMNPQAAIALGAVLNSFGQPAYPTVGGNSTLSGYPLITSAHLPSTQVVLMDQADVLIASDDSVTVDVSREASVQMDSAPATPASPLVSLWQQNLIGLKAEQFAYWMRARDEGVVLITGVDYMATITP
jgi:HK97 family phage major capsid protein